jgi:GAF domain-containing protein
MTTADDLLERIDSTLMALRDALGSRSRLAIVTEALAVADPVVLDGYCATARTDLGATMCLVTLLGDERQTLAGTCGIDRGDGDVGDSLCQYVVSTGEALRVDDTDRFGRTTPGFGELGDDMHSYYGEPIYVTGEVVGAFCALDSHTRHWSPADQFRVRLWADAVERWFQTAIAPTEMSHP